MPEYKLKVSSITQISPFVKVIRFDLNGRPLSFRAGQYLIMGVDLGTTGKFQVLDGKSTYQERPFSISSHPLQTDFLEVTVVGTDNGFTADYFLNYLGVGEEVSVSGPFGEFFFDEKRSRKNAILIGAGSGILPLISMASYIAAKNLDTKVHMLFSFRNEEKIVFRDAIEKLSQSQNISHEFTLTRSRWGGTMGRISKEMVLRPSFKPYETDYYLCGSAEFKKEIENMLVVQCDVLATNIFK